MTSNAYNLRGIFNLQSAALNSSLSYDCDIFDNSGMCLSAGGRYSSTNSPNSSTSSGLLIGSLKQSDQLRLGGWIDQNVSAKNPTNITLGNSSPLFGVFGVWSANPGGLGYQVKVSAGTGNKDVTVARNTTNTGSSRLNSRGIQAISSFGMEVDKTWTAAPYIGLKYLAITRNGYTESGSGALSYSDLRQETTTALAGVSFTGKIDSQTSVVMSAGAEHDLKHNVGQYSGTNSSLAVTTTAFNSDPKKTRAVVSAGVYYDIDKGQRLAFNVVHRQEAFHSTATTSALATYTVGF